MSETHFPTKPETRIFLIDLFFLFFLIFYYFKNKLKNFLFFYFGKLIVSKHFFMEKLFLT